MAIGRRVGRPVYCAGTVAPGARAATNYVIAVKLNDAARENLVQQAFILLVDIMGLI